MIHLLAISIQPSYMTVSHEMVKAQFAKGIIHLFMTS